LDNALQATSVQAFGESLKPKVGERIVDEALKRFPGTNIGKVTQTPEKGRTPSQFDVSHRQKLLWPLRTIYSLSLSGQIEIENRWHKFNSHCAPLPKYCSLVFSAQTDAPSPFSVFWQVVNTGKEARESNGLRGSIFPSGTDDLDDLTRRERTLYTGMHWIECFVVKNGVCIARSGEFVVNVE
jgi:hypothetical protein